MGISEHAEQFADLPVLDYDPARGIEDPTGQALRLAVEYGASGERASFRGLLDRLLADPAAPQLAVLVIGPWEGLYDGEFETAEIIGALAAARDRLAGLRGLFLGDIIQEECEISWINQSDVTPLLRAYPRLEHFRVRGGTGLELEPVRHDRLRSLVLESGGLPAAVVRAVGASELPALEHLELWLGTGEYGGDASVEDLAPILSGANFSGLKYLGLRDCEHADEVAEALAESPIPGRVEVLDLSLGTLGDRGILALLASGRLGGLRRLDIHYHYVSDEVLDEVKALGIDLDVDDQQTEDEYGRYCAVSE